MNPLKDALVDALNGGLPRRIAATVGELPGHDQLARVSLGGNDHNHNVSSTGAEKVLTSFCQAGTATLTDKTTGCSGLKPRLQRTNQISIEGAGSAHDGKDFVVKKDGDPVSCAKCEDPGQCTLTVTQRLDGGAVVTSKLEMKEAGEVCGDEEEKEDDGSAEGKPCGAVWTQTSEKTLTKEQTERRATRSDTQSQRRRSSKRRSRSRSSSSSSAMSAPVPVPPADTLWATWVKRTEGDKGLRYAMPTEPADWNQKDGKLTAKGHSRLYVQGKCGGKGTDPVPPFGLLSAENDCEKSPILKKELKGDERKRMRKVLDGEADEDWTLDEEAHLYRDYQKRGSEGVDIQLEGNMVTSSDRKAEQMHDLAVVDRKMIFNSLSEEEVRERVDPAGLSGGTFLCVDRYETRPYFSS